MSRPGVVFSNGTIGYEWQSRWCDRCLRDAPFRNGISPVGCPILLTALMGEIPDEWMEGDEIQDYTCIEFRAPGDGGGEPRPKPEPTGMDGLFPRPERQVRMLAPLEPARESVTA